MRDRLLWFFSLLFVAWMVWSETSFQYFDHSLAKELSLSSADEKQQRICTIFKLSVYECDLISP